MNISSSGKAYIKSFEALRLTAYKSGKWSIGYGNTYYEDSTAVRQGDVITSQRAEQIFEYWVNWFASQVNSLVKSELTQSQFDALVSYAYNRGVEAFRNSTLLKMVNADPNDPKIPGQFAVEWGTNTAYKTGLIARRKKEGDLYAKGSYDSSNTILVWLVVLLIISAFIFIKKQSQHND